MAKLLEGVYERILECAKKEFLENGFKDASLRVIAEKAGTSTGSIYTRFKDKEGLFAALVIPVIEELKEWFYNTQEVFVKFDQQDQSLQVDEYSANSVEEMVDFIYDHFDIFKLLIEGAYGTVFAEFIESLVKMEVDYTIRFFETIGSDAITSGKITPEFLHIISSGFYTGMFEIVRHHIDRDEGIKYVKQLRIFHFAGLQKIWSQENSI